LNLAEQQLVVRGDLQNLSYNEFNYSTAKGFFFDGNEAYVVEVYDGGRTDKLGVKVFNENKEFVDTVYNQPSIHSAGLNESLSMNSEKAQLPETDKELEAYARYVLQDNPGTVLEYTGPRELDDLSF